MSSFYKFASLDPCFYSLLIITMSKIERGLFVRDINKKYNLSNIDYIYIGDSDCDFKFLSIFKDDIFLEKLKKYNKKYVLVTPIFTRENYKIFQQLLIKNYDYLVSSDFEIVINSWGIYFLFKKIFGTKLKFIWGKWMYFQIKDPMVKLIDNNLKGNINIDFKFYHDFFQENCISGLELVNMENDFSIINLKTQFHIYYPKVSYSTTKYCYSWNLFKKNKALHVVNDCDGCKGKSIKYTLEYLGNKTTHESNTFYYNNYSLLNIKNKASRLIYNYFE